MLHAICRLPAIGVASARGLVAAVVLTLAAGDVDARRLFQQEAVGVALASRSLQPGELVVVTLSVPTDTSDVRLTAFGKDIPVFLVENPQWQALLGIDLDQAPGSYELTVHARVAASAVRQSQTLVVRPKTFATRTLRVSPDFVNPPASLRTRIAREARLVADAYAHSAPERLWQLPFTRPVADQENSRFGQRSVFNGEPRNRHTGADFLSAAGTPIKAPNSGRVALAADLFMSGNTVIIDHGLGVFSVLAHMSAFDVHEGERVTVGQIVGRVGATGRVTGPHLHWAMRVSGSRIDPLSTLALLGPSPQKPPSRLP